MQQGNKFLSPQLKLLQQMDKAYISSNYTYGKFWYYVVTELIKLILGPVILVFIRLCRRDYFQIYQKVIIHFFLWVFAILLYRKWFYPTGTTTGASTGMTDNVTKFIIIYLWPFYLYILARVSSQAIYDKEEYFAKRWDIMQLPQNYQH